MLQQKADVLNAAEGSRLTCVPELFDVKKAELYSGSRKKPVSEAGSVLCYWCIREPGESMRRMAKRFDFTQPVVGYAVDRGEELSKKKKVSLPNSLS